MDPVQEHDGPPRIPVTHALTVLWVAVYLAMTWHQGGFQSIGGFLGWGAIFTTTSHEFGDLTAKEVASGQIWRTVTATFVHFSLLHLLFNAICLVSFGRVLESWYGSPQFLAVYVAIAGLGNAFAVAGRYLLGARLDAHCAGGSSALFGFIAMIAVAGWRMNTRFGLYARRKMTWKLVIYGGIMGFLGRGTLDNYGHAGGAIAGALMGLLDRRLVVGADRPRSRLWGILAALVLIAVALAQVGSDVSERAARRRAQADLQSRRVRAKVIFDNVVGATVDYEALLFIIDRGRGPFRKDPTAGPRRAIAKAITDLDAALSGSTLGPKPDAYRRWHELALKATTNWPSPREAREFLQLSGPLLHSALNNAQAVGLRLVIPGRVRKPPS